MMNNVLVRIGIYYAACFAFFGALFRVFPKILYYVTLERAHSAQSATLDFNAGTVLGPGGNVEGLARLVDPMNSVPVIVALVMAFILTLPITWVYRWTRPRKRYNQAFAHTLMVIPIAIALVVFLVKGSLALAFSLAGIVAAVRFRTSLSEPMDAVYMLIVIGIGLAAGVQLTTTAIFASAFFTFVALGVWKTNFGSTPAVVHGWTIMPTDETGQLLGVSGAAQRTGDVATGDGRKPFNARLRIHTTKLQSAQNAAIPVLEARAKRWQQHQVIQNEDGTSIVEFDVRLKKSTDLAAFIKTIEDSERKHVEKVELEKHAPGKE